MNHDEGGQGLLKACVAQLTSLCKARKAGKSITWLDSSAPTPLKNCTMPTTHVLEKPPKDSIAKASFTTRKHPGSSNWLAEPTNPHLCCSTFAFVIGRLSQPYTQKATSKLTNYLRLFESIRNFAYSEALPSGTLR